MVIQQTDRDWIEEQAQAAGFDLAGVAAVPAEGSPDETQLTNRFADWVAAGRAGEMNWLKRVDATGDLVQWTMEGSGASEWRQR